MAGRARNRTGPTDAEREIMREMGEDVPEVAVADEEFDASDPNNFNIVPNKPLPEDFENPPLGEQGHFCIDIDGNFNPLWHQVYIEKVHDHQRDPQPFPLDREWSVHLETWADVPPQIIISLQDAVETHHTTNVRAQETVLGQEIKSTVRERRRFHWRSFPSAQVPR